MALLWIEGFESFGTTLGAAPSPVGVVGRKYIVGAESSMDVESGRISGYCLELVTSSCYFQPAALTTNATMIVGVAVKFALFPATPYEFLSFFDGVTKGVWLHATPAGEIAIYRGSTLLATTSGLGLVVDAWYYIELKVICNNSGSYELRVDEVNVLSASGVDTQAGSNAYHTIFRCSSPTGATGFTSFDDLYCLDGSGTINNTFLGNKRVATIRPNAAGSNAQFTPSAGDNYAAVDEVICDDNTTYVEGDIAAEKDLYNYEAVAALGGIAGVMVCTDCRETDASSFTLKTVCRSGNTESDDAGQAVGSTNYLTKKRILETDPKTSAAWVNSGINTAQFGVKVG